ncbi:IS200/IS605 family transposase [Lignipirellula cremea]|uniref:Transposase IS200 like protein n=1 Tax=Lignipirellula cremea TaxID=2528010 RepID=A0A518DSU2_9BACT|nr:IS200/IS605 family transposase [Lignipirellula cremea]QDU94911.1 Transposase IS200 like protein [Lignipirellula cremea]
MGKSPRLFYHLVFAVRHGQRAISSPVEQRLHAYLANQLQGKHAAPLQIGGAPDHVHLLVECGPTLAVDDLTRVIKASSARWMNEQLSFNRGFSWQLGFGVFRVNEADLQATTDNITNQASLHRRMTFQDVYLQMLKRHHAVYRPEYLFEDELHG